MTDESTTPPDGEHAAPLAGERLAEARQKREISVHEIAKELHLDEPKVRALEQNAFETLGAPVFAKGYLRKYAELVGIPVDDILADYYRLNRAPPAPLLVGPRAKPPRDLSPGPWLAGLLAIFLVTGAGWWWWSGGSEWFASLREPPALTPPLDDTVGDSTDEGKVERLVEPAGNEPSQTAPVDAGTMVSDAPRDDASAIEALPDDPPDSTDVATLSTTDTGQPTLRSGIELSLTFSGDCWTEVTDAAGERLFFGLGSAGRTVSVEGQGPLQVLLGDSDNAHLAVNGTDYPVPRSARRGATARLMIVDD
ncbi:MAG TPA: RodZ domain-containing protein [Woeseiaceae bacterium]|nr:RodZ domain-containing protein [Woeseiaceae bacterium]